MILSISASLPVLKQSTAMRLVANPGDHYQFRLHSQLLRPSVIQARGDAFAPAKLRCAVLAANAVQHNADFLLGRVLLARRPANAFHDPLGLQFSGFRISGSSPLLGGYDEPEILLSSTY
jgi:hypothetical protein